LIPGTEDLADKIMRNCSIKLEIGRLGFCCFQAPLKDPIRDRSCWQRAQTIPIDLGFMVLFCQADHQSSARQNREHKTMRIKVGICYGKCYSESDKAVCLGLISAAGLLNVAFVCFLFGVFFV
jgi:hypothetical protein